MSAEHLNERMQKIFIVSGLHKMIRVSDGMEEACEENNGGEQG